jgi:hypothetical protein
VAFPTGPRSSFRGFFFTGTGFGNDASSLAALLGECCRVRVSFSGAAAGVVAFLAAGFAAEADVLVEVTGTGFLVPMGVRTGVAFGVAAAGFAAGVLPGVAAEGFFTGVGPVLAVVDFALPVAPGIAFLVPIGVCLGFGVADVPVEIETGVFLTGVAVLLAAVGGFFTGVLDC